MKHDLTGRRFFRITVIAQAGTEPATGLPIWRCRCTCGREHTTLTSAISRRAITPIHCACSVKTRRRRKTGRHGGSSSREYGEWRALLKRCGTRSAVRKGITLHSSWGDSFSDFLGDVGPSPSRNARLWRIDSSKPWEPCNTRWIETTKRRRPSNARLLTCGGKTATLAAWARVSGIKPGTLHSRLEGGWTLHRALTQRTRKRETNPWLRELAANLRRIRFNDSRKLRRLGG